MLFAVVPFRSLEAGPEFYNALYAPHNCVGGSEQGCTPGPIEAGYLFKDPSKMNRPVCVVPCLLLSVFVLRNTSNMSKYNLFLETQLALPDSACIY